ncbi:interleukin-20-like [Ascaphus truei]|uniref:interleukin-20-like n=1 Tax=Ascaphus truei TaxID=8439 RepID=UPI003F5A509E
MYFLWDLQINSCGYHKQSEDKHMDLRIMEQFCLQEIPLSDRCCFLHRMLHFYMGKVLNRYISQNLKHNKSIRDIGNSFYSLSEELNPCHSRKMCSCQDQTSAKLETIEDNFNKLDHTSAAGKALGELDILLDWMEKQY